MATQSSSKSSKSTKTTKAKSAKQTGKPSGNTSRAVIVAGARTPFVKAFGPFVKLDTIELGKIAVAGMLERAGVDRAAVEAVVWGGVILPPTTANVGREIGLDLGLPASAEAMTVSRACASGLQSVTLAAAMIDRGEADVVVAGGSDSTSNASVTLPNEVVHAFAPLALGGKTGASDIMGALRDLWPFNNIMPRRPQIAERTTGELMGESAEKMAKINQIPREEQDKMAQRSHQRAAAAYDKGLFDDEIVPVTTPDGERVERDGLLRPNTKLEKLASLKPVFTEDGSLTAGNSTALTDGGAAVLLMSEDKAKELGLTPMARFKSWSYVGVDPADQLLIGPALSMPQALARAGLELNDIDLIDIHEAFAAQVLSVLKVLATDEWAKERLGRSKAVGTIDPEQINPLGGSLAFGHPFAATGARMVSTVAHELQRSGKKHAMLGICAAGGLGAGAVLERV